MYVCIYIYIYVYTHMCVCIYIYIYICIHTYTCIHIHTYIIYSARSWDGPSRSLASGLLCPKIVILVYYYSHKLSCVIIYIYIYIKSFLLLYYYIIILSYFYYYVLSQTRGYVPPDDVGEMLSGWGGEDAVDSDAVGSKCSMENCLPKLNKRISSKQPNREIWARCDFPTVSSFWVVARVMMSRACCSAHAYAYAFP